jgi:hypothetical protein
MSDLYDKSLLAWDQRRTFLAKHAQRDAMINCLVWVLGKDGKVFGSCVQKCWLGPNQIESGTHQGLMWWPQGD